ncbi:PilX N-terminal domain-containing pilus assembly protein [Pseudoduganella sp. GCM10020061]|uniref:pilus assembly PilX family protein n=1 Tax=Pseudoduganella sp. GCM10020061 TaxID=3317345 RepID=UPI0036297220
MKRANHSRIPQRGAALAVTLFLMIAVLAIGIAAAQAALSAEKQARAERDRQVALLAAEAALRDAERDIESDAHAVRAAMFASGSTGGFAPGCGRRGQPDAGLCMRTDPLPAWQLVDLAQAGEVARAVAYGAFTGAVMATGGGSAPARPPQYIIEALPVQRAGEDASAPMPNVYRITAMGFGARQTTRVVLQSVYRKVDP